jgi:hypothetical protein
MDTVSSSCLQSYKKRKLASGAPTGKPPHFRGLIDNRDLYTVKHIVSSPSIKERDCPQPKKNPKEWDIQRPKQQHKSSITQDASLM